MDSSVAISSVSNTKASFLLHAILICSQNDKSHLPALINTIGYPLKSLPSMTKFPSQFPVTSWDTMNTGHAQYALINDRSCLLREKSPYVDSLVEGPSKGNATTNFWGRIHDIH